VPSALRCTFSLFFWFPDCVVVDGCVTVFAQMTRVPVWLEGGCACYSLAHAIPLLGLQGLTTSQLSGCALEVSIPPGPDTVGGGR